MFDLLTIFSRRLIFLATDRRTRDAFGRCTTAQPNDELERVVHALAYDGVGCVVVVDGGRPIGVRLESRLVSSGTRMDTFFVCMGKRTRSDVDRRLARAIVWMMFIQNRCIDD